ncbi:MAG: septal ring lytic transglycosylase RlpA family protein [Hyphomicrobium sp.]
MRSFMGYATLCAVGVMVGAAPASANWSCDGAEYVCGGPAHVTKASANKAASVKKVGVSKKSASYSPKKARKIASSSTYSSGGGASGKASYYWQPQRVASGGWFNPNAMTAAHKTLPFGTKVRVTNRHNGKSVVVTINDRGPYVAGRIIDLSRAAAQSISMTGAGVVPVSMTVLGRG